MGFTGQLFATRIAIGLAVPSPQALQKTGGMLAQGIANIHQQISQAQRSTSGDLGEFQQNLDKLNKTSTTASQKLNNEMLTHLQNNLNKMNDATDGSLARSFDKTKQHYQKLGQVLSKPVSNQLMSGMKGLGGMEAVVKQAQNFYEMDARSRREVIQSQTSLVGTTAQNLQQQREKLALLGEAKVLDEGAITAQNKKVGEVEEELRAQEEILRNFKRLNVEVQKVDHIQGEIVRKSKQWAANVINVTNQIRTGFNDALRNSVMLLTALGYKLNQNTQELIEFERELLNANSVFNITNDELFKVSNTILDFGNEYGIAVQNGAEGLYQLASAGVDVNEAMSILPETLKLSMAVQGDHNTISKLTAQTLFGFGMEMDQAAEVTDKFAYAIQKSLIEYQDLSSAVKFALPFFTSTGQSIDQLLGALQILTNRALEAGIAGRGLRQALAEFAESALDAETGFRKMGVEILNAQGEMLQLSEIAAQFAQAVGPDTASNTELLTTLIQDLNVRGATAFIHLVQASDEFTQAVEDTANAEGALDEMVRIQNQSLSAQIQILKTNVLSIFAFRDAAYEGTEYINGFHESIVNMVGGLKGLIIEGEGADQKLTEFGMNIQKFATSAMEDFGKLLPKLIDGFEKLMALPLKYYLDLILLPLKIIAGIIEHTPSGILKMVIAWKTLGMLGITKMITPIASALWSYTGAAAAASAATASLYGLMTTRTITGVSGKVLASKGLFGTSGNLTKAGVAAIGRGGVARTGLSIAGRYALGASGVGLAALAAYYGYKHLTKEKASGGYLQGMASGGMPRGGSPYLVGEQGPELFIPEVGGQLLNNGATHNSMGNGMSMRDVTIGIDSFGGIV